MSKISVLISAYKLDKNDVGEGNMAYSWIKYLSRKCNVHVLSCGSRTNDYCGLEDLPNIIYHKIIENISFYKFDLIDRSIKPGYLEYFIKSYFASKRILNQYNIDICHHLAPFSLRYPSPLLWTNKPLIVGPIYGGLKSPQIIKTLESKEELLMKTRMIDPLRLKFDPWLHKHFSVADNYVLSAPYVDELLPKYSKSMRSLISGIAIDSFDRPKYSKNSKDHLKLVSVSRLVASKGIELLIKAISESNNKHNISLDIYGKGPLYDDYVNLSKKNGLENIINWHGFKPNNEVIKKYPEYDVFILPSLKEPAGIAVIEAMSSGLPVICIDAGGPAYSVSENCGIKVPITNTNTMIKKLATAIDFMFDSPEKREQMGLNAQQRIIEHFTWDAVTDKMVNVYKNAINSRNIK